MTRSTKTSICTSYCMPVYLNQWSFGTLYEVDFLSYISFLVETTLSWVHRTVFSLLAGPLVLWARELGSRESTGYRHNSWCTKCCILRVPDDVSQLRSLTLLWKDPLITHRDIIADNWHRHVSETWEFLSKYIRQKVRPRSSFSSEELCCVPIDALSTQMHYKYY